jgi:hypothetical protein
MMLLQKPKVVVKLEKPHNTIVPAEKAPPIKSVS